METPRAPQPFESGAHRRHRLGARIAAVSPGDVQVGDTHLCRWRCAAPDVLRADRPQHARKFLLEEMVCVLRHECGEVSLPLPGWTGDGATEICDATAESWCGRFSGGSGCRINRSLRKLVEKVKNSPEPPSDPSTSTTDYSQPETSSAIEAIRAFRPQVFLDVHSWHFGGDGYWGPDPAAESAPITDLKNTIAKYFKIQHWNHEQYPMASAATIAREWHIAATLAEFALCFDSEKRLKTPESMRAQGVQILRGAYEYLKEMQ